MNPREEPELRDDLPIGRKHEERRIRPRRQHVIWPAPRRWISRYWQQAIGTMAVLTATWTAAFVLGLFRTPGKVHALTVRVDTLSQDMEAFRRALRSSSAKQDTALGYVRVLIILSCPEIEDNIVAVNALPCDQVTPARRRAGR